MSHNLILQTDSYKLTHWDMYPAGTQRVYSYLEARQGAALPQILFFGLQYILKEYLEGVRVIHEDIEEAGNLADLHFGRTNQFNWNGWRRITDIHRGRLPLRIRAVPEGSVVPPGNVLMTIENTDPKLPWLTNALESLLFKVWYPITVASQSFAMREYLADACISTGGTRADSLYMLHDFGYRGVSSEESAMMGGAAHLLNFAGTDTLVGMRFLQHYYGASLEGLAGSVAASEHSIMTSEGPAGEINLARRIIANHQNQIVSLVADSFNYYSFVRAMIDNQDHVRRCNVSLVLRPDSVTSEHPTPESLVVWTLNALRDAGLGELRDGFYHTTYKVLWGDGIDFADLKRIVEATREAGFAIQNLVFGMGGGLLQRVNRDTLRMAIKCSAQFRTDPNIEGNDGWIDVSKTTPGKASKAGRFMLNIHPNGELETLRGTGKDSRFDLLRTVFLNGVITQAQTFDEIHRRT